MLLGTVDRGIFSQLHAGEETSMALATVTDSLDSEVKIKLIATNPSAC